MNSQFTITPDEHSSKSLTKWTLHHFVVSPSGARPLRTILHQPTPNLVFGVFNILLWYGGSSFIKTSCPFCHGILDRVDPHTKWPIWSFDPILVIPNTSLDQVACLAPFAHPAGMLVVALSMAVVVLIQISWAGLLMVKLEGNGIKLRVVAIFFKYNIQGFFWG